MINNVPESIKDSIDKIMPFCEENIEKTTIDVTSTIYTSDNKIFDLAKYYKINNITLPKKANEVLLYFRTPVVSYEYIAAFDHETKMHNFIDADRVNTKYPDYSDISEISLVDAFKNRYLVPFLLFIKNRFIFWRDIRFIHSIHGNYLRILDRNEFFCNHKWYPAREFTIVEHENYEHDRYNVIAPESENEEDDAYYITNEDISIVYLPIKFEYSDESTTFGYLNSTNIATRSEFCFNREGELVTSKNLGAGSYAFLAADPLCEYYIRTSWSREYGHDEDDLDLLYYLQEGMKMFPKNFLVFKDDLLYLGDDFTFNTIAEYEQRKAEGYKYAMITSDKHLKFPISLKYQFKDKDGVPNHEDFNETLKVPKIERTTYLNVAKVIAKYDPSLLKGGNNEIESQMITFNKDMLTKDNKLIMSRGRVNGNSDTFVMIFCDGKLISNYYTIEYILDSFSIQFDSDTIKSYTNKEFEILYFNKVNNDFATYKETDINEFKNGYRITEETDAEHLKLFVDRAARDAFPYIVHDEKTQYEIVGTIKEETNEYTLKGSIGEGKTINIKSKRLILDDDFFYNKTVSFVSSRQFRYNSILFENTDGEFRYELDKEFRFCRDLDKFMVFYNGVFLNQTKYYMIFPDPETAYNSTSIYLRFKCNRGDRLDIFYIPNGLCYINHECDFITNDLGYLSMIKYKEEEFKFVNRSLCFLFIDGRKVPEIDMNDLGFRRICLSNEYNPSSEILLFKHSCDINEDFIKDIYEYDLYNELLDKNGFDENGNDVYQSSAGFYKEMITKKEVSEIIEELDAEIFDRIVVDYYMQKGTHLSSESIPMSIKVLGSVEKTNGFGAIVLSPNARINGKEE